MIKSQNTTQFLLCHGVFSVVCYMLLFYVQLLITSKCRLKKKNVKLDRPKPTPRRTGSFLVRGNGSVQHTTCTVNTKQSTQNNVKIKNNIINLININRSIQ